MDEFEIEGLPLVGHATCTIKVAFKLITKGAKSAFLNVNGGGGGLGSGNLTGAGTCAAKSSCQCLSADA